MAIFCCVYGLVALVAVGVTFVPVRREPFTIFCFFTAWCCGELALQWAVLTAAVFGLGLATGAFTSMVGALGAAALVLTFVGLVVLWRAGVAATSAVRDGLASAKGLRVDPALLDRPQVTDRAWRRLLAVPVRPSSVQVDQNLNYAGDASPRHRVDVYRSAEPAVGPRPVLVYIHGGAWIVGDKREQGKPMLYELAARGWVCISINYRLSPKATWPEHIVDCKRAIAWSRAHASTFGGDPNFLAVAGGSAGGHLAALCALSANDPDFQPGFEDADTSVDACVSLYGVLELTGDRSSSGRYGPGLRLTLERQVFKAKLATDRARFEAASPLHRIHAGAPPFLVLQGRNDTLVPVEVARQFVERFSEATTAPIAEIELPLAQHAFDILASPRCSATTTGIVAFLETVRVQAARPSP